MSAAEPLDERARALQERCRPRADRHAELLAARAASRAEAAEHEAAVREREAERERLRAELSPERIALLALDRAAADEGGRWRHHKTALRDLAAEDDSHPFPLQRAAPEARRVAAIRTLGDAVDALLRQHPDYTGHTDRLGDEDETVGVYAARHAMQHAEDVRAEAIVHVIRRWIRDVQPPPQRRASW